MSENWHLVCGRAMTVAAENFPHALRAGKPVYFCTSFCLEAYLADPERFYAAHSRHAGEQQDNSTVGSVTITAQE
ncbi:MAG: hypothetical protein CO094_12730 [Anaerolineae bacterium CG_4_9_14_3_um_filter_57_17]|nr:hypothetical protein [bacterium]NCT21104.1 hypothetical protein [bacterium]OIO83343.1 MAG: hypothetical protein AUK01_12950 [Anaerolineae bacterium CG2_30_57_67]PJB64527.1 MAG: hypothetical protein CO094_12730 [Anaerolineae bacterium CG_4_9_14_3_um_filter_57_17]